MGHMMYVLQNTVNGECSQDHIKVLNKSMEDFYSISDQILMWLTLSESTVNQNLLGGQFSADIEYVVNPTASTQHESDASKTSYTRFITNAKRYIEATKSIEN